MDNRHFLPALAKQRVFERAFDLLLDLVYCVLAIHCKAAPVDDFDLGHDLLRHSDVYDLVVGHDDLLATQDRVRSAFVLRSDCLLIFQVLTRCYDDLFADD